ncbi:MAG: 5'-nucleotidase C-terminal domain-containing protein [Vicinamibacterales bacterium]
MREYWSSGFLALACAGVMLVGGVSIAGLRAQSAVPSGPLTLSIVGTNDVHGYVFENRGRGGVSVLGGYVRNLRAARAADGGAVMLLDAGDTYQGGIESDLSEGGLVIDAYNAMGYTAAAIGNHDFEFGDVDVPGKLVNPTVDPRGALKAAAVRARFPMLAANLIDLETGAPVAWKNVSPSTIVEVSGLKVGIIGGMTVDGLRATLAAHVRGLRLAPLESTVADEARRLRQRGATVVVVTVHAGGRCTDFGDPKNIDSCDDPSEVFDLAREMSPGLIDAIVAGHTHSAMAHEVNGIPIVEANSLGQAFSRVDLTIDRQTGRRMASRPFAPQELCLVVDPGTDTCAPTNDARVRSARVPAHYEGRPVQPDQSIVEAMAPEMARIQQMRALPLGVSLDTTIGRTGEFESPIGNLFADAVLHSSPGADVAINNNGRGGLRADLPPGPLTFGPLYDVFPFDNRLVRFSLTGAELRQVFENEVRQGRRAAIGVAGVRVQVYCGGSEIGITLVRPSGHAVGADERLQIVTTDQLAAGGFFAIFPTVRGSLEIGPSLPLLREVVASWLQARGGVLREADVINTQRPRWDVSGIGSDGCGVGGLSTR